MRVSKADGSQTLDLQRDALLAAGIEPGHLYEDQASGKRDNRPGLEACLKALRQGDALMAWKLDRLGRDLSHLVNLGLSQTSGVDGSSGMAANLIAPNRSNPHDPECDCREAAAPVQGRLQGPPLPGIADPAGGLLVSALFLSYRDIEELFRERGLPVDHATLNRWVLVYAPLIE